MIIECPYCSAKITAELVIEEESIMYGEYRMFRRRWRAYCTNCGVDLKLESRFTRGLDESDI